VSALTEAIMFIRDGEVVKEMFFAEFEAVLDDVVGVPDFAGQQLQAVFVQINTEMKITGAVFFVISFDKRGRITGNWNIPLRHLLDHASFGPDLGGGVTKVACHSACPVSWYRNQLWDPVMEGHQTFSALVAAVQRNRLGIVSDALNTGPEQTTVSDFFRRHVPPQVGDAEPSVSVAADSATPIFHRRYRERLKALKSAEQLRLATVQQKHQSRFETAEEEFSRQLAEKNDELAALKEMLAGELAQRRQLEASLNKQQQLLDEQKTEYEGLLESAGSQGAYSEELEKLRKSYEKELKLKLQQQAVEFEERLNRRENELYQRSTEIVELRSELSRLREQNRELLLNDDSKMLQDMAEKGVVFVAYHPGIEHLVIDREEMPSYLRDPQSFAAHRCEVSVERYQRWLQHYRLPICRHQNPAGEYCGQPLIKVMRPKLFREGESDRCKDHRGG